MSKSNRFSFYDQSVFPVLPAKKAKLVVLARMPNTARKFEFIRRDTIAFYSKITQKLQMPTKIRSCWLKWRRCWWKQRWKLPSTSCLSTQC